MKTTILLLTMLGLLACGCSRGLRVDSTSIGADIVITNGAAWEHTWNYADSYDFISNTIPQ